MFFFKFIQNKFKRLRATSIFFGILYYSFYIYNENEFTLLDSILIILQGCGHLWFLPMLFWCFVVMWIICKYNILREVYVLLVLYVISILPIPNLLFGLGNMCHFMFYFYGGFVLYKYRCFFEKYLYNVKPLLLSVFIFVLFFILYNFYKEYMLCRYEYLSFMNKTVVLVQSNLLRSIMASVGCIALYVYVYRIVYAEKYVLSNFLVKASSICYGVYIIHQFILKYLYYNIQLSAINNVILPWLILFISLVVSVLISFLLIKTKIGRFLIG
ncbi:acyltransferase family protein [Parabacteroides sp. APC149_11_2_Y6]